MIINERYKYLRRMQPRNLRATRRERSLLLDEMEVYTGLHRKSLPALSRAWTCSPWRSAD